MKTIEQLIDDYKRRIESIEKLLAVKGNGSELDIRREELYLKNK